MALETRVPTRTSALVGSLAVLLCAVGVVASQGPARPDPVLQSLGGRLPLSFETNRGQAPADIAYVAHGPSYSVGLGEGTARLSVRGGGAVELEPVGGRLGDPMAGAALPGHVSYLRGSDPSRWVRDVPTTSSVSYSQVWPGIDLAFHGTSGALEFDFAVAPQAEVGAIDLALSGSEQLRLDADGSAVVTTTSGPLRLSAPVARQGARAVASHFVRQGQGLGVAVGPYDHAQPLLIDPSVAFSSFTGGSGGSIATAVGSDAQSNIYIAGNAGANDPLGPSSDAFQKTEGDTTYGDGFVEKLNASGTAMLYATYLGGNEADSVFGMSVDAAGDVYLGGTTNSTNFPVTSGALQTTFGSGTNTSAVSDAFLAKLNPTGTALGYSTYLGGTQQDNVTAVGVASDGSLYFTGNIPSAAGSCGLGTGKLNAAGSALSWYDCATAAVGTGVAVDGSDNVYVTGRTNAVIGSMTTTSGVAQPTFSAKQYGSNAFVEKIGSTGTLVYRTFAGGAANADDDGQAIAVDPSGNAYITGLVSAGNLPTTTGAVQSTAGGGNDAFALKLSSDATTVLYSTYLGGTGSDYGYGIAADSSGHAYVTGLGTHGLPTTPDAVQPDEAGTAGTGDAFLTELAADGKSLVYSTFLGGAGQDKGQAASLVANGNVVIAGGASGGFPHTQGAAHTSGYSFAAEFGAPVAGGGGPLTGSSPSPGSSPAPSSSTQTPTAPGLVTTVTTSDGTKITITTADGQSGYADLDRHLLGGLSGDDMARLLRNGGFSVQIPLTYPAYAGSYSAQGTASSSGVPGYDTQSIYSDVFRARAARSHTVVVFTYKHTFTKAKSYKVTIKLTSDGKKLLKAANKAGKKLKLSISYSLKAKGHKTISRKLSTTLKPGKKLA